MYNHGSHTGTYGSSKNSKEDPYPYPDQPVPRTQRGWPGPCRTLAEPRWNSAASHVQSTTTHILVPSAMSSTGNYLESTALERWYTVAWYRFGKEMRHIGRVGGNGGHYGAVCGDREPAVGVSRSTDEKSDSTPHAARAGAPHSARRQAVCRRACQEPRMHDSAGYAAWASHAEAALLMDSPGTLSRRVLCMLTKLARRCLSGTAELDAPARGAKSRTLTYSLTYQSPHASIYFYLPTSSHAHY
ncbi:hypothetical protein FB451DRAFT_1190045 [Mycena latifolia]|nr:hypothetical protein FB451DRAFT_1190045 [Mycena latifolia]